MVDKDYVTCREFEREVKNIKDSIVDLKSDVRNIKDNHLVHITSELVSLREQFYDFKIDFSKVKVKQFVVLAFLTSLSSVFLTVIGGFVIQLLGGFL